MRFKLVINARTDEKIAVFKHSPGCFGSLLPDELSLPRPSLSEMV